MAGACLPEHSSWRMQLAGGGQGSGNVTRGKPTMFMNRPRFADALMAMAAGSTTDTDVQVEEAPALIFSQPFVAIANLSHLFPLLSGEQQTERRNLFLRHHWEDSLAAALGFAPIQIPRCCCNFSCGSRARGRCVKGQREGGNLPCALCSCAHLIWSSCPLLVHDTSQSEDGQGLVEGGTGSWAGQSSPKAARLFGRPLWRCVALSARVGAQCCCYTLQAAARIISSKQIKIGKSKQFSWNALIRMALFRSQGMAGLALAGTWWSVRQCMYALQGGMVKVSKTVL